MNITLLAIGSRGDVQPAVALAVGLRRAGHTVRLGSYAQFATLAQAYDLSFTPIAGDITAMLQSAEGRAALESRNPLRLLALIRHHMRATAEQAWADIQTACADADALVSFGPFYYSADVIATIRGLPHTTVQLQPLLATGAFPAPMLPALPVQTPALNRGSHALAELLFWQPLRPLINKIRQEAGLTRVSWLPPLPRAIHNGMPALYAYSELVVPRPADWPASAHVTGFLYLDAPQDYTPSADLAAFLAAGDPPVYIGFGSMNTRDPRRSGELALRALELTGCRGVLMRGWGGLDAGDVPATVHIIDDAPHAWLFPQMAAVVHHGGAGTTAAGLRAGVPAIVVPFFADQPFWAKRVAALGVGPAPIPRARLTAERLAAAIEQATRADTQLRAAELGRRIAAEDGVGHTVTIVEQGLRTRTG